MAFLAVSAARRAQTLGTLQNGRAGKGRRRARVASAFPSGVSRVQLYCCPLLKQTFTVAWRQASACRALGRASRPSVGASERLGQASFACCQFPHLRSGGAYDRTRLLGWRRPLSNARHTLAAKAVFAVNPAAPTVAIMVILLLP